MIATATCMYALGKIKEGQSADQEATMSAFPFYLSVLLDAWAYYWVGQGLSGVV